MADSIRLMGYAAPVLHSWPAPIASGAIARSSGAFRALRVAPLAVAAALLAIGALTTATRASTSLRTADGAAAMASAAGRAAPRAALEVAVDDGWDQAWLAYYLRDREITLAEPSIYFTGFTKRSQRTVRRGATPTHRIEQNEKARVAAAGGLFLNPIRRRPAPRSPGFDQGEPPCRPCQDA